MPDAISPTPDIPPPPAAIAPGPLPEHTDTRSRNVRLWLLFGSIAGIALITAIVVLAGRNTKQAVVEEAVRTPTRYEVTGTGLSISIPAGWARSHVPLEKQLDAYVKFQAGDLSHSVPGVRFTTNVNVVLEPLPEALSLDDYVSKNASAIEGSPALRSSVSRERLTLPVGDAWELKYSASFSTASPLRLLALDQVLLVRGRQGFVVTFTTLEDERDRYEATFQEMARSLRFD